MAESAMPMLKINAVQDGQDIELIRVLFIEYAGSLCFDLDFQNFEQEVAGLPGDYAPPRGCMLLAMYEDQLAGCIALRPLGDTICEMKRLYVRPQFRGLGIGKALTQAVIENARRIGYTKMRLDTGPSMQVAAGLYLSLGFKEIDPYCFNPIEGARFMELDLT